MYPPWRWNKADHHQRSMNMQPCKCVCAPVILDLINTQTIHNRYNPPRNTLTQHRWLEHRNVVTVAVSALDQTRRPPKNGWSSVKWPKSWVSFFGWKIHVWFRKPFWVTSETPSLTPTSSPNPEMVMIALFTWTTDITAVTSEHASNICAWKSRICDIPN